MATSQEAALARGQKAALAEPDELSLPDFAFTGKAGAGKTTAAAVLGNAGYMQHSIAGPLKEIAATIWGPTASKDRGKLQKLGQFVRELDEDAWANLALDKLKRARQSGFGTRCVIDDLRFPNEYWRLKEAGFVIVRVEADRWRRIDRLRNIGKLQDEAQLEDTSETALDPYEADYTLENNGSWSDFVKAVIAVLKAERRRT